jgi:hypothetical protein
MEKKMTTTTTKDIDRNHDEVELVEVLKAESTLKADDMWEDDVDEDYDDEEEFLEVGPSGNRKRLVDWASDALRSVTPAWHFGGKMLPPLKSWALSAKAVVMQRWGDSSGQNEAIVETRQVLNKGGLARVRKPAELSLHEKRLLKAKLVKRVTDGERNLVTRRD